MTKDTTFNPDTTSVKDEVYRREQEAKRKAEEENLTKAQRIGNFFGNSRTRLAIGVILVLIGAYLLIAFLSFCFKSGTIDQSQVQSYGIMENAKQYPEQIHNSVGSFGAATSEFFISNGFGLAAYVLVFYFITLGCRFFKKERKVYFFSYTLLCLFSLLTFSLIIDACTSPLNLKITYPLGGNFGYQSNKTLVGLLGPFGMIAVNFVLGLIWILLTYKTLHNIYSSVKNKLPKRRTFSGEMVDNDASTGTVPFLGDEGARKPAENTAEQKGEQIPAIPLTKKQKPRRQAEKVKEQSVQTTGNLFDAAEGPENRHDPTGEYLHYHFPPLDLLAPSTMNISSDAAEQEANKQRITETLNNYGIKIKKIEVHVGPTITLFEIVPEDGVRINKIRGLEDDIALSLAALGIRIIAPMPGRGTIGIEVPNQDPQVVPIRRALEDPKFVNTKYKLPMAVGCSVTNEIFVADLAKMPHLLVAGATGKGKSVGLNTIIASLLYKKGPSELKLILIDPKRVEFSVYADLEKYYFARVPGEDRCIVTDTGKVVKTLNCLVQEMENRYKVLEEVRERNVVDYNKKWREGLRDILDADGNKKYKFMPYIVCIIDEFSDMIMTAGKEVETPIVRIAQKARAVGIHLIVATQRPSAQVITGNIKGNIPGRMAFAVAQMIDSRIILDRPGAQNLIGRGDMLFSIDGDITRLQCPFIDTPEIIKICNYIKEQEDNDIDANHEEPYELPEYIAPQEDTSGDGESHAANLHDRDSLFEEAARWVVTADLASTSSLQRRYQIGYNRAGRIMDQLEAAGIVGPSSGGKPRKVLMSPMEVDQMMSVNFSQKNFQG